MRNLLLFLALATALALSGCQVKVLRDGRNKHITVQIAQPLVQVDVEEK